jgi:exodeoxyribonuclease-3
VITLADRVIRTTILQLRARQEFGLRWQSAAATPLSALQDDSKSGVALRFPPQSPKSVVAAQTALCSFVSICGCFGNFRAMKLISWNVNGLRAVLRKNFLDFLDAEKPDVLCLQETKCSPDDIEQLWPATYTTFWNSAQKKGYSGTAIFTRMRPLKVTPHIGMDEHDQEGRVLTAEFAGFFLVNVYVPNSKRELTRLAYRQQWDRDFLRYLKKLEKKKPVIFCGDFNVAHMEIDLANPKANVHNHGFTPEERAGFSAFVRAGFLDSFREFEKGGGHYTWWSQMSGARSRNVGWRIDYFLISAVLRPRLKRAIIRADVEGSDHCPVGIELE